MGNCDGVAALGAGLWLPVPENVGAFGWGSVDSAVPLWRWGNGADEEQLLFWPQISCFMP